ncbi:MAG: hypothetical protein LBQ89_07860 [Treponema sp.]|jgi:hypothetical protein|nr:hypothetical protein [Treponema sp.]
MEKKEIHLVYSCIGKDGKTRHQFMASYYASECPYRVSSRNARGEITIPLWFDTEQAARDYVEEANSDTEREYLLIQEFTYENDIRQGEAKIVFTVKSDTWPTLDQGRTERSPGIWADVRSFFLFDKKTAFDYIRRFNEDAVAASKVVCENKGAVNGY